MSAHRFKDTNNQVILAAQTDIPGLVVAPVGVSVADIEIITEQDFDLEIERVKKKNKNLVQKDPVKELTEKVAQLQDEIDKLKQKDA